MIIVLAAGAAVGAAVVCVPACMGDSEGSCGGC